MIEKYSNSDNTQHELHTLWILKVFEKCNIAIIYTFIHLIAPDNVIALSNFCFIQL